MGNLKHIRSIAYCPEAHRLHAIEQPASRVLFGQHSTNRNSSRHLEEASQATCRGHSHR